MDSCLAVSVGLVHHLGMLVWKTCEQHFNEMYKPIITYKHNTSYVTNYMEPTGLQQTEKNTW